MVRPYFTLLVVPDDDDTPTPKLNWFRRELNQYRDQFSFPLVQPTLLPSELASFFIDGDVVASFVHPYHCFTLDLGENSFDASGIANEGLTIFPRCCLCFQVPSRCEIHGSRCDHHWS